MGKADSGVPHVLVIDDDVVMLESCRRILERTGCAVDTEPDALAGRDRVLRGSYDLVLLDLRMPKVDGLEVLAALGEHRSDLEVIIITGYATVATAVKAVRLGAFDYLPKPFTPDELRARAKAALDHLAARRRPCPPTRHDLRMVGDSPAMANVHALIARVAASDASVLIVGESGTGKELAAIEIHARSHRRERPFVSLDCSTLAPGLLESELFGHVKGSFTGAIASKPGLFETADRGTLFLDEISSLSLETQGKLLRVLETGEIKPVGDVGTHKVDIRLIAASNRAPEDLVREKTFREDLYYRLNVVPLRLPPLRERSSDIPLLLERFLAKYRSSLQHGPRRFSPDALERLVNYRWPGNVRELKNLVERLVVTVEDETIRIEHLPESIAQADSRERPRVPRTNEELKAMKRQAHDQLWRELERTFVIEALRRSDWNVSRAARETGLLRPNFHALMRKYGIQTDDA
jgi:DNA-binding NtrC family response regulator